MLNLTKALVKRALLLLLSYFVLSASAWAQSPFVHTRGSSLIAPDNSPLLLRGTNLGNWLEPEGYMFEFKDQPQSPREIEALVNDLIGPVQAESFWRSYRDAYITEDDIRFLHEAGFNSLRVPFHYKFFAPGVDEGFQQLDRLVGWARKYHLFLILDMHCAPGGQTGANIDDSWGYPWLYDTPEDQQLTVVIWKRIAAHYRDEPTVLGYDLLNEPIPHFPQLQKYNSNLEPLYKKITAGIREVDPNHIIILGGAQWDSNFKVFGPPFDKNVMYTFHKYWTAPTQTVIQPYLDYRDRYHVPIWLGESGENTDDWIRQFVAVLDTNKVGWAFWPYKKMEKPSAVVSFKPPRYWDEIVAYAAASRGTGNVEKQLGIRPSAEHIQQAVQDLLHNVRFQQCHVNDGYLQALGLKTTPTSARLPDGVNR